MDMFVNYPGLGVVIKNSQGKIHRVEGSLYSRLREIKSNNRNIYFRMLELHCAGRFDDVNLFLQFFPEYLQGVQDMTGVKIPKLINTLYY